MNDDTHTDRQTERQSDRDIQIPTERERKGNVQKT